MLKSMTGYGRAKVENAFREILVEVKSVNHRYLDMNLKTPRIYGFLDEQLKAFLVNSITRGKLEVYVSVKNKEGSDVKITPNFPVIQGYLDSFQAIADKYNLVNDATVLSVAKLSESLSIDKDDIDATMLSQEVLAVLEQAVLEYNTMRTNEGGQLCKDILERADFIDNLVQDIEKRSPECEKEYREKISIRMIELLGDSEITEGRIVAEAAVFADKISITEEIVRLGSHLKQLRAMIKGEKAVGRKLDFLLQELNREANTIGSKANDSEVARLVIDMKAEIEKIREQIQNLE